VPWPLAGGDEPQDIMIKKTLAPFLRALSPQPT
jgi:hypothetical protein